MSRRSQQAYWPLPKPFIRTSVEYPSSNMAIEAAFRIELRRAGLRVVYTPWSKALDRHPEIVPPEFNAMLASSFGEIAREDRYYHPFYSRDVPYRIDEGKA